MSAFVNRPEASWLKTYIRLPPGVAPAAVEQRLRAAASKILEHSTTPWLKAPETIGMEPAGGGVSGVQRDYRQALAVLGVLVALVLLIACANVANLMTAQGTARAREMALRVAIGAGRRRLVQLVLVESAMLALFAGAAGGLFTWWSAPFVVGRINPLDNPMRLSLDANWRVLAFGLAVTVAATVLFGLAPALRASAVKPALALKGGEDPHSRRRSMHALIAVQVAFSFLVLFVAGLLAGTFERLSHQPVGFSTERLLNIDTTAERAQPPVFWDQVAERLRAVPGVETVTLADWPPLDGYSYKFNAISIDGGAPSAVQAAFMNVSPGWIDAMKIPFVAGRDFRPNELSPSVAIVNEAFARQYFKGENPIGRSFAGRSVYLQGQRFQIVGLVRDARYRYVRQDILPVAYTPFHRLDAKGAVQDLVDGTFSVRTASPNPLALASTLRREVTAIRPGFRVSNIRTEQEIIESQTVRERLLAMLALFFAAVALLLAAIGLYGVLDYSVFQQRRAIGIRMAIGAQTGDIARPVTFDIAGWICAGSLVGLALGIGCARFIESLLYQVKATDVGAMAAPALALIAAAIVAALPPVIRAIHIDPASVLRSE
jgi:predicted permease